MKKRISVDITLRTIVDGGYQNKKSIWLPTTKQELEKIMSDKDFEESANLITEVYMPLCDNVKFKDGSGLTELNLLAEKIDSLNDNNRNLLYSILSSKKDYFSNENAKITPHNICSLIDNLHNYRLHNIAEDLTFDKILKCSTNYLDQAIEYIGTEDSYVNNYEKYKEYEIPYDNQFLRLTIQSLEKVNKIETLTFPLNGDDYSFVANLSDNTEFKINSVYAEFEPYVNFNVNKKELLELNDFASEYYDGFGLQQTKFNALYEYYNERLSSVEGITFDEYENIYENISNYEIRDRTGFQEMLVEKYCEFNNISKEIKELIDEERLFEKLFENEPIYITNEGLYVYNKAYLIDLLEQYNQSETQDRNEEQGYEGLEM